MDHGGREERGVWSEREGAPELNALDLLERFFLMIGAITAKARTREGFARPMSLRAERAQAYWEVIQGRGKKSLLRTALTHLLKRRSGEIKSGMSPDSALTKGEKARDVKNEFDKKDRILGEYLRQREVGVEVGGAGVQKARYAVINPEESESGNVGAPIVLIPGAANDLSCVEGLARELAYRGRKVFVIGHPDSVMGEVTEEFVGRVSSEQGYEAHAEFFRGAIEELVPQGQIEIWGHSAGAPIAAEMLRDGEIRERVERAVLLAPACSVTQTNTSFASGIVNEIAMIVSNFRNFPRYVWTIGRGGEKAGHRALRLKSLQGQMAKVLVGRPDLWECVRVREGGEVVVVSGRDDRVTKSGEYFGSGLNNPQMRVLQVAGGHAAALIDPGEVLDRIEVGLEAR